MKGKKIIEYESSNARMRKMGLSRQSFHLHHEEEEKIKEPKLQWKVSQMLSA